VSRILRRPRGLPMPPERGRSPSAAAPSVVMPSNSRCRNSLPRAADGDRPRSALVATPPRWEKPGLAKLRPQQPIHDPQVSLSTPPIPTGLRPPAQGCEARATLGTEQKRITTLGFIAESRWDSKIHVADLRVMPNSTTAPNPLSLHYEFTPPMSAEATATQTPATEATWNFRHLVVALFVGFVHKNTAWDASGLTREVTRFETLCKIPTPSP
jgi:hypothetical protein